MSFLVAGALGILLLALAPFIAHLLQRRRADEREFPPARLVPASPPVARRRYKVDDRALYAVRTISVLALALLGATPFVRCSSLAMGRRGGASIAFAVVLDDSLSMLADANGTTRWDRAKKAARELVSGAREGDSVGIVLAGSPPRIALAPTTDLAAARGAVDSIGPSHRATDLDGALELARSLVQGLPQTDRRVVLLSDLADGRSDGTPLGEVSGVPLWVPLTDITEPRNDCAIVRADRQRNRASVRVACSPVGAAKGRSVTVSSPSQGGKVIGEAKLPDEAPGTDVEVDLSDSSGELLARLTGKDAIAEDDEAPVLAVSGQLTIGIVADPQSAKLVTGGAPPGEQALAALELDLRVRPLPLLPDRQEDFAQFAGLLLEDPPGFTPETRRSLTAWLERGGVALLALGPHAPLAPLGTSFEPLLRGPVAWGPSPVPGLDDRASPAFGFTSAGLLDLHPQGRATLDLGLPSGPAKVIARWKDDAPWLVERPIGRGLAYILSIPTSPDQSDLALRPAFLVLLERFVDAARARNGAHRTSVGEAWTFEGAKSVKALGPNKSELRVTDEPTGKVVVPDVIGVYEVSVDGDKLVRVAAPAEREIDLRPRAVAEQTRSATLGDVRSKVDLSPYLAVVLLGLLAVELALRLWAGRIGTALKVES